jgi:hypothetical protein
VFHILFLVLYTILSSLLIYSYPLTHPPVTQPDTLAEVALSRLEGVVPSAPWPARAIGVDKEVRRLDYSHQLVEVLYGDADRARQVCMCRCLGVVTALSLCCHLCRCHCRCVSDGLSLSLTTYQVPGADEHFSPATARSPIRGRAGKGKAKGDRDSDDDESDADDEDSESEEESDESEEEDDDDEDEDEESGDDMRSGGPRVVPPVFTPRSLSGMYVYACL